MKKTQFKIGLLTACLIGANSAFCNIASAQSCGAEACDSKSCKCSKKHCDDSGLLEIINSAASNFESGLANMLPEGKKQKAKPSCGCSKCAAAASEYSHSVPMMPPTVYEENHFHAHPPRAAAPINPIHNPIPTSKPSSTPVPIPVPMTEAQDNPFKDDTTRNYRSVPTRPASLIRSNNGSPVEYDPQARAHLPLRSIMATQAASRSVSDMPFGLATNSSTRRGASMLSERMSRNQDAANQIRTEAQSVFQSEASEAPSVVPASSTSPLRNLRELETSTEATSSTNANASPAAVPTRMYVNPLRVQ